jgi:hypothetical protein
MCVITVLFTSLFNTITNDVCAAWFTNFLYIKLNHKEIKISKSVSGIYVFFKLEHFRSVDTEKCIYLI